MVKVCNEPMVPRKTNENNLSDFIKNVEKATALMRELFPLTPLQKNEFLSQKYEADVFLKREDLSPVRSYKIRGAFNSIKSALERNPNINSFETGPNLWTVWRDRHTDKQLSLPLAIFVFGVSFRLR